MTTNAAITSRLDPLACAPPAPPTHPSPRPKIILGVTGSVAAVKAPEIALRLRSDLGAEVRVVLSAGGTNFWNLARGYRGGHQWRAFQEVAYPLDGKMVSAAGCFDGSSSPPPIAVYSPDDEWAGWSKIGDPVLHVDLRDWADVLVVAPLSAHNLAKIAGGLCDDPLSCVARAWDFGHGGERRPPKPMVLVPAMNSAMWLHPLTGAQLDTVRGFYRTVWWLWIRGFYRGKCMVVVEPQTKVLACGELGPGALAEVDDILEAVRRCLSRPPAITRAIYILSRWMISFGRTRLSACTTVCGRVLVRLRRCTTRRFQWSQ